MVRLRAHAAAVGFLGVRGLVDVLPVGGQGRGDRGESNEKDGKLVHDGLRIYCVGSARREATWQVSDVRREAKEEAHYRNAAHSVVCVRPRRDAQQADACRLWKNQTW